MIQGRGLRALFFLKSIKVYILAEVDVTHTHTQTPIITPELSIRPRTHTKHAHLPVLVTPCCLLGKRSSSVSSIEELRHRIGRGELIKILNDNQKASLWENFDLTVRSECVSQHYLWYSALEPGEAFKHCVVADSGRYIMSSSWAQAPFSRPYRPLIQGTATLLYIATDWAPGVTYGMERYTGQDSLFIRVCVSVAMFFSAACTIQDIHKGCTHAAYKHRDAGWSYMIQIQIYTLSRVR